MELTDIGTTSMVSTVCAIHTLIVASGPLHLFGSGSSRSLGWRTFWRRLMASGMIGSARSMAWHPRLLRELFALCRSIVTGVTIGAYVQAEI